MEPRCESEDGVQQILRSERVTKIRSFGLLMPILLTMVFCLSTVTVFGPAQRNGVMLQVIRPLSQLVPFRVYELYDVETRLSQPQVKRAAELADSAGRCLSLGGSSF